MFSNNRLYETCRFFVGFVLYRCEVGSRIPRSTLCNPLDKRFPGNKEIAV